MIYTTLRALPTQRAKELGVWVEGTDIHKADDHEILMAYNPTYNYTRLGVVSMEPSTVWYIDTVYAQDIKDVHTKSLIAHEHGIEMSEFIARIVFKCDRKWKVGTIVKYIDENAEGELQFEFTPIPKDNMIVIDHM